MTKTIEPIEAYARGLVGVIQVLVQPGQPIESGQVRVDLFVLAEGTGVLAFAEDVLTRLWWFGPEQDGWSVFEDEAGLLYQLAVEVVEDAGRPDAEVGPPVEDESRAGTDPSTPRCPGV